MNPGENYLKSCIKEFSGLKSLGERSFAQIRDEDFFVDFLTSDGEKEFRKRDEEFERLFYTDKDDVLSRWEKGWKCLFDTLSSLKEEDLLKEVFIRKEKHTVTEAVNRQLAHYGYHIGQIVYIAKHLESRNWKSLSIPRGKSGDFNAEMNKKSKGE